MRTEQATVFNGLVTGLQNQREDHRRNTHRRVRGNLPVLINGAEIKGKHNTVVFALVHNSEEV